VLRSLVFGRVPSRPHPELSGDDTLGEVETKRMDGRPAGWRQAENLIPCRCPTEVITPWLSAWIIERDEFSAERVESGDAIRLAPVTLPTGQPKVLLNSFPASRFGCQVIDHEIGTEVSIISLAVAAAMPRLRSDPLTEPSRDKGPAHERGRRMLTSWPRSRSKAAAFARMSPTSSRQSSSCASSCSSVVVKTRCC
jgi:hypothetical protein